ncbi:streptomycin biosynthesis protein [Mycobacterium eburneum]|nr:ParB N-terminal domain-containing protein [Mycobacterium eburneum]TDH56812.1 streptomycin biosynthesis protein [Mycobacterium eburneum]
MPQTNESHALNRQALPLTHAYGNSGQLSAFAVEEWVRQSSSLPVENVPVASIRNSYTPRKSKTNEHHVKILAQSPLPLPPIVIHRTSMRVIDGVHRLRATELRGDSTIPARFFEGNNAEAFALAVHLNVSHGLPLTLAERKAAARRIVRAHPQWSDRSIALIAGVSNKTVGKLRECATEEISQLGHRLGRDGKIRPASPVNGRRRAAEFLSINPRASLREIAREAGVSVTTARDVRRRIDNGENPLPDNLAKNSSHRSEHGDNPTNATADRPLGGARGVPSAGASASAGVQGHDLLQRLRKDPSIRCSERGRALLRLLSTVVVTISTFNELAEAIPIHCSGTIAEIARKHARAWQEIADKFDVP